MLPLYAIPLKVCANRTDCWIDPLLMNAFNNVNFRAPGTTVGTSSFGVISAAEDPRILQFGLKVLF